ncbi:MAG: Smr/MutS family protein [Bacteroidota bacterium]|nr:Smr/MutS family protein [Bacteroidota bacterium]MDP4214333.1 Smr/MutS family protein [Bacteroidota bacterium]
MKFQVGDKVTVLHSNEEAEVVEMINDKMVMVDVRGVKFPAYIDQLDFPYFKRFSEKKDIPQKKEKRFVDEIRVDKSPAKNNPLDGVWLSFLPVSDTDEFGDEVVESLKIHLINHSASGLHFQYKLSYFGKMDFELQNDVAAGKDFYLHDMSFATLNDSPSFDLVFSLSVPDKKKAPHYERSLKLKPRQVFMRIEEIRRKGGASFTYKLFDVYPEKPPEDDKSDFQPLEKRGYKMYDASKTRQHLEPAKYEVDLHIEKLTEAWSHLSNFEMLTLQLNTFEKYLDLAIAHHQRNLIVIHGVGTGKLKDEIHEILKSRREVRSFINQYDPRYGYGATEIFL